MVVTVNRQGAFSSTNRELSFEAFRAMFKALASKRGAQGVYLRADGVRTTVRVVRVLAVMRQAGVGDIGLVAEPMEAK